MKLKKVRTILCVMAAMMAFSATPALAAGVADQVLVGDSSTAAATETITDTNPKIRRDIEDGMYILVPKLDPNLSLGIAGNSKDAGGNVEVVGESGNLGKAFYVKRYGNTSRYTIVNNNSGLSLTWDTTRSDVDETHRPASFVTQQVLNSEQNQQWVIEEMSGGYMQIRACGTSMVLDLANGLHDEGTDIRVYQKNQTDAQKWILVKLKDLS